MPTPLQRIVLTNLRVRLFVQIPLFLAARLLLRGSNLKGR